MSMPLWLQFIIRCDWKKRKKGVCFIQSLLVDLSVRVHLYFRKNREIRSEVIFKVDLWW